MTPATLNLKITRGTTFGPLLIECQDSEETAVNLTGWVPHAHVRRRAGDKGTPIVDLAPAWADAVLGKLAITLSDMATDDLPVGSFVWDLLLEDPEGRVLGPFASGRVTIADPVTQPS